MHHLFGTDSIFLKKNTLREIRNASTSLKFLPLNKILNLLYSFTDTVSRQLNHQYNFGNIDGLCGG